MSASSLLFGPASPDSRVLAWFSCGAASAVAAHLAVQKYGERCEVLYCDTFANEHPDNRRFFDDCEKWIGREIKVIGSDNYEDIYDVFERTGWLVGVGGARCTVELKKNVRRAYQRPDDIHIFGYTPDEQNRADRLTHSSPELFCEFPLIDQKISKSDCHSLLNIAGIEQPAMYRMGYRNNNCIGCVKGQAGYWNKIRVDFPEIFERMSKVERNLGAAICKKEGKHEDGTRWREVVYLDELDPKQGRYEQEADIDCGVLCIGADTLKKFTP